MAIYFEPRVPSTGQKAGENLASGIGEALDFLTKQKLQSMQQQGERQRIGKALQSLNLSPELAQLPPNLLNTVLGGHFKQQLEAQKAAQEQLRDLGYLPESTQIQQSPAMQESLIQEMQPQVSRAPMTQDQALQNALQGSTLNPEQVIRELAQKTQPEQKATPLTKQSLTHQTQQIGALQPWQILKTRPKGKFQTDLYKQAYAEQKEINKEVHPYVELLDKKGGALAKASYPVLERLNKLVDEGNLTKAKVYNQYKRLEEHGHKIGGGIGAGLGAIVGGIAGSLFPGVGTIGGAGAGAGAGAGIGSAAGTYLAPKFIGSPADQEFQKLTFNFMNGLKDIFGGRLNETEVKLFADSIPSLSQTKKGKRAIINNMKLTLDAWTYKKKIKDEIKKEHGGHYPANIEELVEERSTPYTDEIARKFVAGIV